MGLQYWMRLERTRRWKRVIDQLSDPSIDPEKLFHSTLYATTNGLSKAVDDKGLIYSFWLLSKVVHAATERDFGGTLRGLHVDVSSSHPTRVELLQKLSTHLYKKKFSQVVRTDVWQFASEAVTDTIRTKLSEPTVDLLGQTFDQPHATLRKLASGDRFADLAGEFFGRFLTKYTMQFVERELGNHVGQGKRFLNLDSQSEFKRALEEHCRETGKVPQELFSGWYGKHAFKGTLTESSASGAVKLAVAKILAEIERTGKP